MSRFGIDYGDPYHPTNVSGTFVLDETGLDFNFPQQNIGELRNQVVGVYGGFSPSRHQRQLRERENS